MKTKPLVLILCGGRSLRLWPLSEQKSKNFIDIFGFSPLELTLKRFLKVTTADKIFLVASKKEKKAIERIKSVRRKNIILEPESKNTAAAVLLSLQYLKKFSKARLIISPVDHRIEKEKAFYRDLSKALEAAAAGWICTLGIKPSKVSADFGCIQTAGEKRGLFTVRRFIEKPSLLRAGRLISSGNCFYNSGMFTASVDILLGEYQKFYPAYKHFVRNCRPGKLNSLYRKIADIAFDRAIIEKSKKVKMIKGNFSWKDFGSWPAIYDLLPKDKFGNTKRGRVYFFNGKNNLVYQDNPRKKVLALGVKDVFLIDTEGCTLLAGRNYLNSLKPALKRIPKN